MDTGLGLWGGRRVFMGYLGDWETGFAQMIPHWGVQVVCVSMNPGMMIDEGCFVVVAVPFSCVALHC